MITTYCYVAAKTAGHILPALALAHQQISTDALTHTLFISTTTQLDYKLLSNNPDVTKHVAYHLPNIPYRKPWLLPLFTWQFIATWYKSFTLLRRHKPQRVITTGGLIAVPVCLAGWLLGIPIDLYELNAEPGGAIKWLSKLATHIYYCFDQAADSFTSAKRKKINYPLYNSLDVPAASHDQLGLDPQRKTVFMLGGSQGSSMLNQALKELLSQSLELARNVNIIHQIGGSQEYLSDWRAWYTHMNIPAHVFSYEPTCVPYYKLADIVICRSGAGTLFELQALKKPYITIPLETKATQHQVSNALAMKQGYPEVVTVISQSDLQTHALESALKDILNITQ